MGDLILAALTRCIERSEELLNEEKKKTGTYHFLLPHDSHHYIDAVVRMEEANENVFFVNSIITAM